MHRFFEIKDLNINQKIWLNKDNSHKIISVLKLKKHTKIILFNNSNYEFLAEIINLELRQIEVIILELAFKDRESPIKIHLAQAIAKNDNMDWVVQKSVELGVQQITPIISGQTIVKPKNPDKKVSHWQAIATAACCQCGRNLIPKINPIIKFNDFIKQYVRKNNDYKFILSPDPNNLNSKILKQLPENVDLSQEIIILIGPEGGFNNLELDLANKHLFTTLQIGPRILRTETAPIVILSILQKKFGDL